MVSWAIILNQGGYGTRLGVSLSGPKNFQSLGGACLGHGGGDGVEAGAIGRGGRSQAKRNPGVPGLKPHI